MISEWLPAPRDTNSRVWPGLMKTRHNSDILGLRVLADLLRSRSGVTLQST